MRIRLSSLAAFVIAVGLAGLSFGPAFAIDAKKESVAATPERRAPGPTRTTAPTKGTVTAGPHATTCAPRSAKAGSAGPTKAGAPAEDDCNSTMQGVSTTR
jgi:hypothetical protein